MTRVRIAVAAAVALLAVLGIAGASNSTGNGAFPDTESAEWRSQLDEMYARSAQQQAEHGPKILLPEGPRQGWIDAYRQMRSCYIAHGFNGAPDVGDSFGDGNTGQPLIDTTQPAYEDAFVACPMPLTPEISAAWEAAIPEASARAGLDKGVVVTPDGERLVGNPVVLPDGTVVVE